MNYNLKLKYKGKRGYWNTTIYAENDKEAIEKTMLYVNGKYNIEKIKLEKLEYKYKEIYKENFGGKNEKTNER